MILRNNSCSSASISRFFTQKFANHWGKSLLISTILCCGQLKMPYHAILWQKPFFLVDLCMQHKPYWLFVVVVVVFFCFFFCEWSTGCLICISGMNLSQAITTCKLLHSFSTTSSYYIHYILRTLYQAIMVSCSKEFQFLIDSTACVPLVLW